LEIIDQKTILRSSEIFNPNNELFTPGSFSNAYATIGFTFDKKLDEDIMVFGVVVDYETSLSPNVKFEAECYHGSICASCNETPSVDFLFPITKDALKRINDVLLEDGLKRKVFVEKGEKVKFSDDDLRKWLKASIKSWY